LVTKATVLEAPAEESPAGARLFDMKERERTRAGQTPTARLRLPDDGGPAEFTIIKPEGFDNDDASLLFNSSLGSTDPAFGDGLISQLVNSTTGSAAADPQAFGFALAVVQGIEPRDEIEGMLAAQMAVVHMATMRIGRVLACAKVAARPRQRRAHLQQARSCSWRRSSSIVLAVSRT
jgi:hypothetical protein